MTNIEQKLVGSALEKAQWNQRKAAQLLELSYDQFRGLFKKYSSKLKQL